MLTVMIVMGLILSIIVNVASSCYVCYNVVIEPGKPNHTLYTISGIVLLNALVPFMFGALVGLWYI